MIAYKEVKQENEGLYVYLDKVLRDQSAESASVKVTYWPKGRSEKEVINTFFADESIL